MTERAIRLVKHCLALAASTTHIGERESALARANELCLKYRLDPTIFVLPEIGIAAEPKPNDPVYDAEFWAEWEAHWQSAKANQRRGGKSIDELMRDPEWVERMAASARQTTNDMAAEVFGS